MYGVSRRTVYNIQCELGLTSLSTPRFTDVSNSELGGIVTEIKQGFPDIGQSMLKGMLESRGVHIPTARLRECLSEVDPVNTALRWSLPISRRVYSVPFANALWHIDGNHKLIRLVNTKCVRSQRFLHALTALMLSCLVVSVTLLVHCLYAVFVLFPCRWRFVIHGGVDGFSRFIVYLWCSTK